MTMADKPRPASCGSSSTRWRTNCASYAMYNFLRSGFTQAEIVDIALPQNNDHLIGSNNSRGPHQVTVTFHHHYYKDLWDRLPRLRGGNVHNYNLYIDSTYARLAKSCATPSSRRIPALRETLDSTYNLPRDPTASISTEGGAMQRELRVLRRADAVAQQPDRRDRPDITPAQSAASISCTSCLQPTRRSCR